MKTSCFIVPILVATLGGAGSDQTIHNFHWSATVVPHNPTAPEPGQLAGQPALRFSRTQQTRIELGQGPADALKLTGPFCIQTVLSLHAIPSTKVSIVSKWQTRPGGRSYELGVTPFGWLFFTVSASGNWDRHAAELLGTQMLRTDTPYHVTAIFEPGKRMALYLNGHPCGQRTLSVPQSVFDSSTPVWLGNRFGNASLCGLDGSLADVHIANASPDEPLIRKAAARWNLDRLAMPQCVPLTSPVDLDLVRTRTRVWYERLMAPNMPYGAYRLSPGRPADMYASADIAWIRWMMDDLDLTAAQRQQWIQFLQEQQNRRDGTYRHITGHCPAHAFCHATGALNMLGGTHRYRPSFLDVYRDIKHIPAWLEHIDWVHQWGASHDIWGAGLPLACSPETPPAWREALFDWLDREVDSKTGFWRRGTAAQSPLESLGGAFHIWPIHAALQHPLPCPMKVIDQVLKLQRADGSFDGGFGYGNMDGVWVLDFLLHRVEHRRHDVVKALESNLNGLIRLYNQNPARFFADAHGTESRIATLAMLQHALPEKARGSRHWRNPWSERELFCIRVSRSAHEDNAGE